MAWNDDPLAAAVAPKWYAWAQQTDPLGDYGAGSWSSWAPGAMYSYGNQNLYGESYDPTYGGEFWSPLSTQFGTKSLYDADYENYMMRNHPELYTYGGSTTGVNDGSVSNLGGDWGKIETDSTSSRSFTNNDIQCKIFHRRVQGLFNDFTKPMNLIDK